VAPGELDLVVIGGSAGSLEVLLEILPALPADLPVAVAIVLHLMPTAPSLVWQLLGAHCRLPVREVEDKEPICAGTIYVAPPNYHLLIERHGAFALAVDAPVNFSRPSIDVLFGSAAHVYGARCAGLLLSGANDDGAEGLERIHRAGGATFVQDPATASSDTMPQAALRRLGTAARVLTIPSIASVVSIIADATIRPGTRP